MPTPNDETVYTHTPIDTDSLSRIGCPPEDERQQAPQNDGNDDTQTESSPSPSADEDHGDQTAAQEVEEVIVARLPAVSSIRVAHHNVVELGKAEHIEDAGIILEPASPTVGATSESVSENEIRLTQSMSATAISLTVPPPQYVMFPDTERERLRSTRSATSFLRPGSKFRGTQQSDRQIYDVQVEIKDVDLSESFLCGYLRIQGLTDDHPTLTTFFEGEIIGDKYTFKTTHSAWNSSEKIDLQHWARFPAWNHLAKSAKTPKFTLKNYLQREHLFMRWKEYFLVPDHRVKTITGASFEGFYYICFNQCSGSVSGIYFHAKSEKYQRLELKHVDDHGCMSAVDFR